MNQEDMAKNDLFHFDDQFVSPIYDPYRTKNLLKDMTPSHPPLFKKTNKVKVKVCQPTGQQEHSNNYRNSLKKLLEKLDALPSPGRQPSQFKEYNSINMISSTQPVLSQPKIWKPNSQHQTQRRSSKKDEIIKVIDHNHEASTQELKGKKNLSLAKGKDFDKKSPNYTTIFRNQDKVRRLIKSKLAERNSSFKSRKTLYWFRQDKSWQFEGAKEARSREKQLKNPRKLTHLLLFQ